MPSRVSATAPGPWRFGDYAGRQSSRQVGGSAKPALYRLPTGSNGPGHCELALAAGAVLSPPAFQPFREWPHSGWHRIFKLRYDPLIRTCPEPWVEA